MLESAVSDEFLFATELADYLVQKFNLPFREAHSRVGKLVRYAAEKGVRKSSSPVLRPAVISEILGVSLRTKTFSVYSEPSKGPGKAKSNRRTKSQTGVGRSKARLKVVAKHVETLASFRRGIERGETLLDSAEKKIKGSIHDEEGRRISLAEVKE